MIPHTTVEEPVRSQASVGIPGTPAIGVCVRGGDMWSTLTEYIELYDTTVSSI